MSWRSGASHDVLSARLQWTIVIGLGAWIAVLQFLRWPAPLRPQFNSNSTIDSAFFALAGDILREGGTPYVSFWDHKPPLIYIVDALALALSGGRIWGLWVATLAALLTALGLAYVALRRTFGAAGAVVGVTVFACSLVAVAPFNLTEAYVLPVQAAAMLVLATTTGAREMARSSFTSGLAVGVLGGLAFFLRQNLIGAPVAVAITMCIALAVQRRPSNVVRLVAGLVAGAGLVVAVMLLWLARAGALRPFWDQVFHYNFVYSAVSWRSRIRAAFDGVAITTAYATLLLPLAGWMLAVQRLQAGWRRGALDAAMLFAVVWLPLELALAALPGRTYGHYFATLLLPLGYLAAFLTADVFAVVAQIPAAPSRQSWRVRALAIICIAIAAVPVGRTLLDARDAGLSGERAEQVALTARYVRTHSAPDARVLVWGHAADVYLLAERKPASRFAYQLPLLTPRYADSALVRGFVDELRVSAPPLIVDATPNNAASEDLVPALDVWNPRWRYPESGVAWWTMTPALKMVYDYMAANYRPIATVGPRHWVVYGYVEDSTSGSR